MGQTGFAPPIRLLDWEVPSFWTGNTWEQARSGSYRPAGRQINPHYLINSLNNY